MRVNDYQVYLDKCFQARITPLIWGVHGVGKTQSINDYCERNGHKTFTLCLGNMQDLGDVLGLADFVKNDKGEIQATKFARPNWMNDLFNWAKVNPTKYAVIHLDEINRTARHLLTIVLQMALNNRLHEELFPKNVRIVASANPPTKDYEGTVDMRDKAYWDRFCHLKLVPTADDWLVYARNKGLNSVIVDYIQEHQQQLMPVTEMFDIDQYVQPGPRSAEAASRLMDIGAPDELIDGVVGSKFGHMMRTWYAQNKAKTITVEDLLKYTKATKAQVAKLIEQDRRAEIASMNSQLINWSEKLEKAPTKKQAESVFEYMMDLPNDMMVAVAFALLKTEIGGDTWGQEGTPLFNRCKDLLEKGLIDTKKLTEGSQDGAA